MESILEIRNLTKRYKDVTALDNVCLSVRKGEFVSVIGRSGAGKSTFLRCINRMVDASGGEVILNGVDVCGLSWADLRRVRSRIGMIFQHYNLVQRLTVMENVLHGRLGYKRTLDGVIGHYTHQEKLLAVRTLVMLGLVDQMYKRCDELSGGQKQRVGIARALVQEPLLILCDEPIASLDPGSAKIIMDHLRRVCDDFGITILVNLHQVDVAIKYSDRIVGINSGRIVYDGSPKTLSREMIHEVFGSEAGELLID
ncbi:MAG TPA: phosphonate ABC transporter ATP-binding protein [Spirochaetia bacterium]|nr:phosphonate ABC transporter ATP-binding protein [Spirochaetia bacterium]